MVDLSVIIVNYNTKELTYKCVLSLYENLKTIKFEVIIVDNASKDDSVQFLRERLTNIILISNEKNLGFSKANNQAIKISKGRYVLLLNSDTYLTNNVIEKMIYFMERNPEVGVVGIRLLNLDGSIQNSSYIFPSWKTVFFHLLDIKNLIPINLVGLIRESKTIQKFLGKEVSSYLSYADLTQHMYVDVVPGACMMVRREVFESVGFLDERFFLYFEDIDFCRRVKSKNWKIVLLPDLGVIHFGGYSFKRSFTNFSRERYMGVLYYFSKYHGIAENILIRLIFLAIIPLKISIVFFSKGKNKDKKKVILNAIYLIKDCIFQPLKAKERSINGSH